MTRLRRYQKAAQFAVDVERDAIKIMGYEKDSNQIVGKERFEPELGTILDLEADEDNEEEDGW
jgi:hypothetical protein